MWGPLQVFGTASLLTANLKQSVVAAGAARAGLSVDAFASRLAAAVGQLPQQEPTPRAAAAPGAAAAQSSLPAPAPSSPLAATPTTLELVTGLGAAWAFSHAASTLVAAVGAPVPGAASNDPSAHLPADALPPLHSHIHTCLHSVTGYMHPHTLA
jgi:hypothetical protein